MRFWLWVLGSIVIAASVGCSVTSNGAVTGRYEAHDEVSAASADGSWNGEPISVVNDQGSVRLVGVPGKKNISVRARFVAGANSQDDAEAAFADIAKNIEIKKVDGDWDGRGGWSVNCPRATEWHGSVDPVSTGCAAWEVEVPAGSVDAPIDLTVRAGFGGAHVSGVTTNALEASAPFGIVVDVTPSSGAKINLHGDDLVLGFCSTILRVPARSTIETASLSVSHPKARYVGLEENPDDALGAYVEGFQNAPAIEPRTGFYAWHSGSAPFAATQIDVHASLGKAILTTDPVPAYDSTDQCKDAQLRVSDEGGVTGEY